MPTASEKAREGGGNALPPLTQSGVHKLIAAHVGEEKEIKSGDHAGEPIFSVCWENEEGTGQVWDNISVIDVAWSRLSSLWLALGQDDCNFDTVEENAYAVIDVLRGKPAAYAEVGMGKAKGDFPAKMGIKWFHLPEEGELKLQNKPAASEEGEEIPF